MDSSLDRGEDQLGRDVPGLVHACPADERRMIAWWISGRSRCIEIEVDLAIVRGGRRELRRCGVLRGKPPFAPVVRSRPVCPPTATPDDVGEVERDASVDARRRLRPRSAPLSRRDDGACRGAVRDAEHERIRRPERRHRQACSADRASRDPRRPPRARQGFGLGRGRAVEHPVWSRSGRARGSRARSRTRRRDRRAQSWNPDRAEVAERLERIHVLDPLSVESSSRGWAAANVTYSWNLVGGVPVDRAAVHDVGGSRADVLHE